MDYSKLSDFEINRLVAIAEGHKCYYGDGSYTNDGQHVTVKGNGFIGWFQPCSEPDIAFRIIMKNNISLHAPRYREGWMAEFTGSDEDVNDGFDVDYFQSHHANPLRAAMIVFLMMQDSDNVPANSTGSDLR